MRFVFGIGTGFNAKGQAIDPIVAKALVDRLVKEAVSRFGGCFLQRGEGAWKNGKGEIVLEPGITLTCEVDEKLKPSAARIEAGEFAEFARQSLNQEAILVTEIQTRTQTVSADSFSALVNAD